MTNFKQKNVNKKITAIFLLSFFIIYVFFTSIATVKADFDQWEAITPSGTDGYTYNCVSAIGNYVYIGTSNGIYKSVDSGSNWTQINSGLGLDMNITAIAIGWSYDFDNSIYVATTESPVFISTASGVYASTFGGDTWTEINNGLDDISVSDLQIDQYDALLQGNFTLYAGTNGSSAAGIYRSDDQGSNWSLKDSGMSGEGVKKIITDYVNGLAYNVTTDNKLYSGPLYSLDYASDENWSLVRDNDGTVINDIKMLNALGAVTYLATGNGVYKSDGGTNWSEANTGLGNTDVRAITSDYLYSDIAYAGTHGGGIYKTVDEAATWIQINKNLTDLNIKDIESDPSDSSRVYAVGANGIYKLELTNPYEIPVVTDTTDPEPVTDLSVTNITTNTVELSWTAPGDDGDIGSASSYDIRYSTALITAANWSAATALSGEPVPADHGAMQQYAATGLSADTDYYFAIKSTDDSNNESDLSVIVMAHTDGGDMVLPATIANLTASNIGTSSLRLNWTAPGDDGNTGTASTYDIRYSTSTIDTGNWNLAYRAENEPAPTAPGTSQNYILSGIAPGTQYYFGIRTLDEVPNTSGLSNIVSTTTFSIDATAPVLAQVTPVSTPTNDTTPNYTFSSTEAGTITYGGDCSSATTNAVSGNNTITFNTLTAGTHSNCTIRVTDSAGNPSNLLNINSFIIDITAPVISVVAAASVTQTSASISWTTNEVSSTQVEYGLSASYGSFTALNSNLVTSHSQTLSGLTASTTYHYRARSTDEAGNLALGSDRTFATLAATSPDTTAPVRSGGSPSGALAAGTTQTNITLTTNENATCRYASSSGTTYASSTVFATTGVTSHSVLITGLANGGAYNYYIKCQDVSGNTNSDNYIITFSVANPSSGGGGGGGGGGGTPTPQPVTAFVAKPTNFSGTRTETNIALKWVNPVDSNFSKAILIRSGSAISDYLGYDTVSALGEKKYEGTGATYTDNNIVPNLIYYYALFGVDKSGKYSTSSLLSFAATKKAETNISIPANNAGTTGSKNQKDLAGASKEVVEQVSLEEAVTIYRYNKYIALNNATRRLYVFITDKSPTKLTEQEKYAIAYYIHNGTPTTQVLGAGERTGVLNSYLTAFEKLPNSEEEWQDVIKIANGRWPDERKLDAEKAAQNTLYVRVYKRRPDMNNAFDNAAVTVITYGLRPRLRNMDSEKAAIRIFEAIFNEKPESAVDWDIVRAIAYSGSKR